MVAIHQPEIEVDLGFVDHASSIEDVVRRLERGLAIIAERRGAGLSVVRHEDHWIALLRSYERLVDSHQSG